MDSSVLILLMIHQALNQQLILIYSFIPPNQISQQILTRHDKKTFMLFSTKCYFFQTLQVIQKNKFSLTSTH